MQPRNRSGFALPIAIGAIVVIGTLVTGVFFAATQESRIGRNTVTQERGFRSAESALNFAYGTWNNITMNRLATGAMSTQVFDSSATGWRDTVRVTRLNSGTFMMTSTSYAGAADTARSRTGVVIRIIYPKFNFLGALTVRGPNTIGGSSYINGADTIPTGWTECPPAGVSQPGIATQNRSTINFSGCSRGGLPCIDGNPDIKVTSAAGDTTNYFVYGADANWATLTASATRTFAGDQTLNGIGPVVSGGACDTSNPMNWGDANRANPAGACESYFPILYFSGRTNAVHITTGKGQGILLVDGDLIVDGGFEFYGPVIVRGHITTQGTGGHFIGGVMAADVDLEQNAILGNAVINYSSCSINESLVGSGIAKRVPHRSWAYVF